MAENRVVFNRYELRKYLAYVNKVVDENGWLTNQEESKNNTSYKAWDEMTKSAEVSDKYYEMADKNIEVLKELKNTEFIMTLKLYLRHNIISYKDITRCSYIFKVAYDYLKTKNSDWVGNVGDKLSIKVQPTLTKEGYGNYGTYYIYKFIFFIQIKI